MLNGMPSMSSDLSDRQWRFYVEDMLGFCDRVLRFNAGVSREKFAADPMRYDATVRNIELIGEAATHISLVIRQANPNVPWRMIIATRNQLIHGYAGIDMTCSGALSTPIYRRCKALCVNSKQALPRIL